MQRREKNTKKKTSFQNKNIDGERQSKQQRRQRQWRKSPVNITFIEKN